MIKAIEFSIYPIPLTDAKLHHMQSPASTVKPSHPYGLIILIILFPVVMIPLTFYDVEITYYFYQNKHKLFGELMKRTFFKGFKFGVSDPAIVFQIIVASFYFYFKPSRNQKQLHTIRPFLGFVLFSSLVTGLGLVHSIKWVIGRARPHLVFSEKLPFSNWFEFGPHFVSDGIFFGSFPSGHVATVFLLLTVSYWLVGNPYSTVKTKLIGWVWGGMVMVLAIMMSIGRCMTAHHWMTDNIGIMLLAWISLHLSFYYILKIPDQIKYTRIHEKYASLPRYWELKILWRMFFVTLGVMGFFIGVRSVLIPKDSWLIVLTPLGASLAYYLFKKVKQIYRESMVCFLPN